MSDEKEVVIDNINYSDRNGKRMREIEWTSRRLLGTHGSLLFYFI